jgi:GntR family transcriptional regulator, transcriptional repressor for pyruvate dehydrogenase complex
MSWDPSWYVAPMAIRAARAQTGDHDHLERPGLEDLPISATPRLDRAVKTSERVASAIVGEIVAGKMKQGDRLPNEAAMVERFQVGRGSLREALRILEVQGLISLRSGPGGGPVIVAVDPRDIARTFSLYLHLRRATVRELIEARLFIEPMLARMAAVAREPEGLQRLRDAIEKEAAVEDGDMSFVLASNNFHYVMATLSGNSVIDLVAAALKELYTSRVVAGGLVNDLDHNRLRDEHKAIANAIIQGKPQLAERLAQEHTAHYLGIVANNPAFAESIISWG